MGLGVAVVCRQGAPLAKAVVRMVHGRDVAAPVSPLAALRDAEGSDISAPPPRWMIEAAVLRALGAESYLFVCVANSARSQMAEGIALHLLGKGCRVQSSGSSPTRVNPLAEDMLSDVGIDISGQRSKSVGEIDPTGVEVVVTLCAEEVCPVFFGAVKRVHWGLADPAAATGTPEAQLQAFRSTRDELVRRILRLVP